MNLRSGRPFWPLTNGLLNVVPPLDPAHGKRITTEVLIIGAGITGALLADRLAGEGREVVALDRRDVAAGSTSASTALLQYEIDTNLVELADLIGLADAERAYQLCKEAIDQLRELVAELPDDCGFGDSGSLYYASRRRDAKLLEREARARTAAGLEVEFLDRRAVEQRFGISAPAAIWSRDGASVDPYRLANHLLHRARENGARLFDRTEVSSLEEAEDGSFRARTDRGVEVRARWVIVAAGYEAEKFLRKPLAQLKNSYALVTEPVGRLPWPEGCLLWETARPYLYARTTADGRVIVGGEDDGFHSPLRREASLPRKQRRLERKLETLLPGLELEVAFAWSGTFGETKDGLAYLGPQEAGSQLLFALGYGGNGITYSVQAARLLAATIAGREDPDLRIFRLDR